MDRERIRVVHLISGLGVGGAETMLALLARHHHRERFEMTVVTLLSGGETADEITAAGVEVIGLGQTRGRLSPAGFTRLLRTVRGLNPHILQGHMFHSNLLARLLKLFLPGTVVIATRHTDREPLPRRLANRLTAFLGDGTVVFSERVRLAERVESPRRPPVFLVPYGIEIPEPPVPDRAKRRALGVPEEAFVWIAVGRLSAEKGFEDLLEAMAGLDRPVPAVLLLVGDGDLRRVLENRAAALGISTRVRFLGYRRDLPELYACADAFVLSSLWEGGPLVVLEAMAHGLPVVATRVGDTSAMVAEGVSGLLVEAGDREALAAAMGALMDRGAERERWGQAGRQRAAERYGFPNTRDGLERLYRDLVAGGPGGDV